MNSVIFGAEGHLPSVVRSAVQARFATVNDGTHSSVVVVADPADDALRVRELVLEARRRHPEEFILAVSSPDVFATAFEAGADEAVNHDATSAEVEARLRRRTPRYVNRAGVATRARRLTTLGALAQGLAHDFNNLLTVILGNAVFLREETELEGRERLLRDLEHAAARAGDLTEQVLRYAGSANESLHQVDLNVLVRDVAPFLQSLVVPQAELRLELAGGSLEIEADVSGLTQLLVNLAQNAAEATAELRSDVLIQTGRGDVIESVAAKLEPSRVLAGEPAIYVEVRDYGPGMTESVRNQAFEPFFSTRGQGRGLGLSMAREVARAHGGGIELDSEPGRGTRVRVWLPSAEQTAAIEASTSAERWASRGLVLVADDEPEVRALLRRTLVMAGFQVLEAEDGAAIIDLVHAHPHARLLILDFTMPRLDGAEVVRRLNANGHAVSVLMMSGYPVAQVKPRLSNLEVAGFLKKPFLPGAVMAKVRRILKD